MQPDPEKVDNGIAECANTLSGLHHPDQHIRSSSLNYWEHHNIVTSSLGKLVREQINWYNVIYALTDRDYHLLENYDEFNIFHFLT